MTKEELSIYNNHPKRRNIKVQNICIGYAYKQIAKIPYIDSTIHRNQRLFGQEGNVVIVENTYVDNECGVLFVAFKCKDTFTGISVPIGVFGYYFRAIKNINKK